MFFKNYYSKPGKGVDVRDPNKPRILVFFEVFSRKWWDLLKLNLLYMFVSLPFFAVTMVVAGVIVSPSFNIASLSLQGTGIAGVELLGRIVLAFLFMMLLGVGPTTAGFTYIIREYANERHCWLLSDFLDKIKSNFKQGFLLWLIDIVVMCVLIMSIGFYGQVKIPIMQYIIAATAIVYLMMHIYIYQIMVTFDMPLKNIFISALLLTIGKAPMNLILLACNFIVFSVLPMYLIAGAGNIFLILLILFIWILFLPAVMGFIKSFCISPVLEKYSNADKSN